MKNQLEFNKLGKASLFVTDFYALMGAWLIIICAFLAFTHLPAWNAGIKTFAVFFLALWFLAIASLELLQVVWVQLVLLLYHLFCLHNQGLALFIIMATVTGAFRGAVLSWRKALAVHFEAFCFFADTACSFFLWGCPCFSMFGLTFLLNDEWKIEWVFIIVNFWLWLSDVFLEERQGTHWEVPSGLNELKSLSDGGNGGEAEGGILRK